MMRIAQKLREIEEILNHPTNRDHRFKALIRYLSWNIGRRLLKQADYAIHITPSAQVILSNRENYATLAYLCGLYDFQEMLFLCHYLRRGDVFGDFGANVGVYSVLAGSLGASVLSVEPIPETYTRLKRNLLLNGVGGESVQCGLSDAPGVIRFTSDLGGLNHVALQNQVETTEVEVVTGDDLVKRTGLSPKILKIDVEGYELPLLRGSIDLLSRVHAIIIELNGSGERYGFSDQAVVDLLYEQGFGCFDYQPGSRQLSACDAFHQNQFNALFIQRDELDAVRSRIREQPSNDSVGR